MTFTEKNALCSRTILHNQNYTLCFDSTLKYKIEQISPNYDQLDMVRLKVDGILQKVSFSLSLLFLRSLELFLFPSVIPTTTSTTSAKHDETYSTPNYILVYYILEISNLQRSTQKNNRPKLQVT